MVETWEAIFIDLEAIRKICGAKLASSDKSPESCQPPAPTPTLYVKPCDQNGVQRIRGTDAILLLLSPEFGSW